jgi:hypothetical protein
MKGQLHRISVTGLTVQLPRARMKLATKHLHSVQTRTTFTKKYKGKLNSKKESHRSFHNLSPLWEHKNKIQTAQVSTFIYSYVYIRNFVSKRRTWIEFRKKNNTGNLWKKQRQGDKRNKSEENQDLYISKFFG